MSKNDANDAAFGKDNDSSVFNEKAILGETLDVNLQGGTYSWKKPNAIPKDDIRSNHRSKSSSVDVASNEDSFKRIPFDGCGSILIHQQPEALIEPNTYDETDNETSGRHRRKGRTGVSLWSASYVISYYIDAQWSKGGSWYCDENVVNAESSWTVLELGAGLGLCSAVAAKHGMNVVSTDNDSAVLTLLKENLQRNQIHDDSLESAQSPSSENNPSKQQVHVHSLDWVTVANDPQAESSHPVFLQLESLGGADLILLSDVIFGATQPAWNALLTLLNKVCAQRRRIRLGQVNEDEFDATGTDAPLVFLGYTQRRRDMSPQDEARFFAMVQAAGMEAVLIPSTRIPNGEKYMMTSLFQLRWVD